MKNIHAAAVASLDAAAATPLNVDADVVLDETTTYTATHTYSYAINPTKLTMILYLTCAVNVAKTHHIITLAVSLMLLLLLLLPLLIVTMQEFYASSRLVDNNVNDVLNGCQH